jgi:hypothetical protein
VRRLIVEGDLRIFLDCESRIRDFYFRTFGNSSLCTCVLLVMCFVLFICFFFFGLVLVICWFRVRSISFNLFLL